MTSITVYIPSRYAPEICTLVSQDGLVWGQVDSQQTILVPTSSSSNHAELLVRADWSSRDRPTLLTRLGLLLLHLFRTHYGVDATPSVFHTGWVYRDPQGAWRTNQGDGFSAKQLYHWLRGTKRYFEESMLVMHISLPFFLPITAALVLAGLEEVDQGLSLDLTAATSLTTAPRPSSNSGGGGEAMADIHPTTTTTTTTNHHHTIHSDDELIDMTEFDACPDPVLAGGMRKQQQQPSNTTTTSSSSSLSHDEFVPNSTPMDVDVRERYRLLLVADTNILLSHLPLLFQFRDLLNIQIRHFGIWVDSVCTIPRVVFRELDQLKIARHRPDIAPVAREVVRQLVHEIRRQEVENLDRFLAFQTFNQEREAKEMARGTTLTNDDTVLMAAKQYHDSCVRKSKLNLIRIPTSVVLFTNDKVLQLKSAGEGVLCMGMEEVSALLHPQVDSHQKASILTRLLTPAAAMRPLAVGMTPPSVDGGKGASLPPPGMGLPGASLEPQRLFPDPSSPLPPHMPPPPPPPSTMSPDDAYKQLFESPQSIFAMAARPLALLGWQADQGPDWLLWSSQPYNKPPDEWKGYSVMHMIHDRWRPIFGRFLLEPSRRERGEKLLADLSAMDTAISKRKRGGVSSDECRRVVRDVYDAMAVMMDMVGKANEILLQEGEKWVGREGERVVAADALRALQEGQVRCKMLAKELGFGDLLDGYLMGTN